MFRTSKCSSSGRLVHPILWYFFQASIKQSGRWQDVLDKICRQKQLTLNCIPIKVDGNNFQCLKTIKKKTQQNAHLLHWGFNVIIVSSTCFEHQNVHPQEDLYMQFYCISFTYLYKQSGRWQKYQAHPATDHTAYTYVWKKYHKTACRNLPEDEHLDVRNMSKTI
jgi:hypothetical protein